jgi:hypothetical protein
MPPPCGVGYIAFRIEFSAAFAYQRSAPPPQHCKILAAVLTHRGAHSVNTGGSPWGHSGDLGAIQGPIAHHLRGVRECTAVPLTRLWAIVNPFTSTRIHTHERTHGPMLGRQIAPNPGVNIAWAGGSSLAHTNTPTLLCSVLVAGM